MFTYPESSQVKSASSKIVQKLILVSMIEIEEETEYDIVQFYSKELLDILGLIVGESELKTKRMLSEKSKNEEELTQDELLQFTLNEVIKKCFTA